MSLPSTEPDDACAAELRFGRGGVPWYLLALYLAFLVFFTWYVLEYQLPDFIEQGPGREPAATASPEGR